MLPGKVESDWAIHTTCNDLRPKPNAKDARRDRADGETKPTNHAKHNLSPASEALHGASSFGPGLRWHNGFTTQYSPCLFSGFRFARTAVLFRRIRSLPVQGEKARAMQQQLQQQLQDAASTLLAALRSLNLSDTLATVTTQSCRSFYGRLGV